MFYFFTLLGYLFVHAYSGFTLIVLWILHAIATEEYAKREVAKINKLWRNSGSVR